MENKKVFSKEYQGEAKMMLSKHLAKDSTVQYSYSLIGKYAIERVTSISRKITTEPILYVIEKKNELDEIVSCSLVETEDKDIDFFKKSEIHPTTVYKSTDGTKRFMLVRLDKLQAIVQKSAPKNNTTTTIPSIQIDVNLLDLLDASKRTPRKEGVNFAIEFLRTFKFTADLRKLSKESIFTETGLWQRFEHNVKNVKQVGNYQEIWNQIAESGDVSTLIISAFNWADSAEGYDFWDNINTIFDEAYKLEVSKGLIPNKIITPPNTGCVSTPNTVTTHTTPTVSHSSSTKVVSSFNIPKYHGIPMPPPNFFSPCAAICLPKGVEKIEIDDF